MRPLVLCSEARLLDSRTQEEAALPGLLLIEDAAVKIWAALEPLVLASLREQGGRVGPATPGVSSPGLSSPSFVALVGRGNNGGDALAVLRQAAFSSLKGRGLAAVLAAEPEKEELASIHATSLRALGIPLLDWASQRKEAEGAIRGAALLLDGLSGTGLKGGLRGAPAEILACAASSGLPLASIDLPSGLCDSYAPGLPLAEARYTLSIEPAKLALYAPAARFASGEIIRVRGVFPEGCGASSSSLLLEEGDLEALLPKPSLDAHKGRRGRLALFAGSPGMTGAARLASASAAAASAGIVNLFVDPELLGELSGGSAVVQVNSGFDAERCDAALAGPGWGRGVGRMEALERIIESGLPCVLDADALRLLASLPSPPDLGGRAILTPHPGEFAALSGHSSEEVLAGPAPFLIAEARRRDAFIVLKAATTWIASPDGRIAVWDGRDPSLATAGSGDVLAGLIGGLLAAYRGAAEAALDGAGLWNAAVAGVVAHGLAGRRAWKRRGWYEARSLVEEAALILAGKEGEAP
jgi:ADP-dependent NAD(P)H-hydrate dehydratase / NAD(P)H-hydrate epimerase